MPPNAPGLMVWTLARGQRQAECCHRLHGGQPSQRPCSVRIQRSAQPLPAGCPDTGGRAGDPHKGPGLLQPLDRPLWTAMSMAECQAWALPPNSAPRCGLLDGLAPALHTGSPAWRRGDPHLRRVLLHRKNDRPWPLLTRGRASSSRSPTSARPAPRERGPAWALGPCRCRGRGGQQRMARPVYAGTRRGAVRPPRCRRRAHPCRDPRLGRATLPRHAGCAPRPRPPPQDPGGPGGSRRGRSRRGQSTGSVRSPHATGPAPGHTAPVGGRGGLAHRLALLGRQGGLQPRTVLPQQRHAHGGFAQLGAEAAACTVPAIEGRCAARPGPQRGTPRAKPRDWQQGLPRT